MSALRLSLKVEDSPPSNLVDPENPSVEAFRARLTSMLRLRLAAVAINEAGFNIDDVDDETLNSQVQAHPVGRIRRLGPRRSGQGGLTRQSLQLIASLLLRQELKVKLGQRKRGSSPESPLQ